MSKANPVPKKLSAVKKLFAGICLLTLVFAAYSAIAYIEPEFDPVWHKKIDVAIDYLCSMAKDFVRDTPVQAKIKSVKSQYAGYCAKAQAFDGINALVKTKQSEIAAVDKGLNEQIRSREHDMDLINAYMAGLFPDGIRIGNENITAGRGEKLNRQLIEQCQSLRKSSETVANMSKAVDGLSNSLANYASCLSRVNAAIAAISDSDDTPVAFGKLSVADTELEIMKRASAALDESHRQVAAMRIPPIVDVISGFETLETAETLFNKEKIDGVSYRAKFGLTDHVDKVAIALKQSGLDDYTQEAKEQKMARDKDNADRQAAETKAATEQAEAEKARLAQEKAAAEAEKAALEVAAKHKQEAERAGIECQQMAAQVRQAKEEVENLAKKNAETEAENARLAAKAAQLAKDKAAAEAESVRQAQLAAPIRTAAAQEADRTLTAEKRIQAASNSPVLKPPNIAAAPAPIVYGVPAGLPIKTRPLYINGLYLSDPTLVNRARERVKRDCGFWPKSKDEQREIRRITAQCPAMDKLAATVIALYLIDPRDCMKNVPMYSVIKQAFDEYSNCNTSRTTLMLLEYDGEYRQIQRLIASNQPRVNEQPDYIQLQYNHAYGQNPR